MNTIVKFLFFTLCSFGIISCNENLCKNDCRQLIIDFYSYPNILFDKISIDENNNIVGNKKLYDSLANKGLLFKHKPNGSSKFQYKFTQNGGEYLIDELNNYFISERAFDQISMIKFTNEEKTKANVEYTCILYNVSPFGFAMSIKEGSKVKYIANLEKYDEGWRITNPNPIIYKSNILANRLGLKRKYNVESNCFPTIIGVAVNKNNVPLRESPIVLDDNILFEVSRGTLLKYMDQKLTNNKIWYKVCFDGKIVWVSGDFSAILK